MASRQKEEELIAALKTGPLKSVLVPASICPTVFSGGRHGIEIGLYANKQLTAKVGLIERKDGTYQVRCEPADWILEAIKEAGFDTRKSSEVGAKNLKLADED